MRNFALSIGTEIIDLEWPWRPELPLRTLCWSKDASFGAHHKNTKIWTNTDPYYHRQKCWPM